MGNIEDIPEIRDQAARLEAITVDCYGRDEGLSGFEVYLTDALHPPSAPMSHDPDEPGRAEPLTVLGVADVDQRRGVLLRVQRPREKERRVLAEQVSADEAGSAKAIVFDDYRAWVGHGRPDPDWDDPYWDRAIPTAAAPCLSSVSHLPLSTFDCLSIRTKPTLRVDAAVAAIMQSRWRPPRKVTIPARRPTLSATTAGTALLSATIAT